MAAQSPLAQKELEALRKDAERYRWLRNRSPMPLLQIAWGASKEACAIGGDCDAAIDAAMKEADET